MSRAWFQQRERGSRLTMRLIVWIALRLGRRPARMVLYPVSWYFLLTGAEARRASRNYLRRILGRTPRLTELARHVYIFSATILDRVYFLAGQEQRFEVVLHNPEILLSRIRAGQGCMLLGAHLGSFEAMRALAISQQRFPLKILMYRNQNRLLTELLDLLNVDVAQSVIPLGGAETLFKVQEALHDGALVGVLGDRVAESDKNVECEFLGTPAQFPAGPMLMAATFKVPVILCFALYCGGNRYEIHFELLSERVELDRSQREQQLQLWIERYVERLEHYARLEPYNWFNFYDFWNEQNAVSQ